MRTMQSWPREAFDEDDEDLRLTCTRVRKESALLRENARESRDVAQQVRDKAAILRGQASLLNGKDKARRS